MWSSIFWVEPLGIGRSAHRRSAPLLIAFIATVIGGMNSLMGAVVGGFVYGLLFNVLSIMLPASMISYRDAFMFVIVILFLLFRPEGLIRGRLHRGACRMSAMRTCSCGTPRARDHAGCFIVALLVVAAHRVNVFAPVRVRGHLHVLLRERSMLVLGLQMFMGNSGILNWTYVGFVGIGAYAASHPVDGAARSSDGRAEHVSRRSCSCRCRCCRRCSSAALSPRCSPRSSLGRSCGSRTAVGVITLFATLIVIHVVMTQWDNVTNGPRTFFGVPAVHDHLDRGHRRAVVTLLVAHFFRESSLGLRLRASRDDRHAAKADRHQRGRRALLHVRAERVRRRAWAAGCGRTTSRRSRPSRSTSARCSCC